jgi:SagB-type dehydrogenase family enzyme
MTDDSLSTSPGAVDALQDDDVMFTDGVEIMVVEGNILIVNAATGAYKTFTGDALPVLEQFMDWISPGALMHWTLKTGEGSAAIDRTLGVFRNLLEIDVLMQRHEDLTGTRLPSPGEGWDTAMRFLLGTRTSNRTVFAVPAEYNAYLAQKATVTRQASAFMEFVDAPFQALSPPATEETKDRLSFPEVMLRRRTARRFAEEPLTETQLATLLYFGWGMTKSVPNPLGDVFVRKTSPSGGSLHPVEVYPIVLNVENVPQGCFHYSVRRHGLEQLWSGDPRSWIVEACGDQQWVREAGVVFLCTAFLPRTAWKYDYSRVARAVMAEIGFTGQSALLTAAWLGLGGFTTAALRDEMFEALLGLDPLRQPVFSVVGMGNLEPDIENHSRPRAEGIVPLEGA